MDYKELMNKTSSGGIFRVRFRKLNGETRFLIGSRPNLSKEERSSIRYDLESSGNVIFKDHEIGDYRTVKAANVISIIKN